MFCATRVIKSKPRIHIVNTTIAGLRLQRALSQQRCVFDFLSRTHDLSLSQARPWVEQLLPAQRPKWLKGLKESPLTHINKHSHS